MVFSESPPAISKSHRAIEISASTLRRSDGPGVGFGDSRCLSYWVGVECARRIVSRGSYRTICLCRPSHSLSLSNGSISSSSYHVFKAAKSIGNWVKMGRLYSIHRRTAPVVSMERAGQIGGCRGFPWEDEGRGGMGAQNYLTGREDGVGGSSQGNGHQAPYGIRATWRAKSGPPFEHLSTKAFGGGAQQRGGESW